MRVHTTIRHAKTSPAVRKRLEQRLARIEKFAPAGEAHVILDVQRNRHIAEIILHVRGHELVAREEASDPGTAIDAAVERLEKRLKRLKDRTKTQRLHAGTRPNGDELVGAVRSAARATLPRGKAAKTARVVAAADEGGRPRIVPARGTPGKPQSVDEAAERLLSDGQEFFAFVNAETEQLNVLYRRKDGDLGLIAPKLAGARRARTRE